LFLASILLVFLAFVSIRPASAQTAPGDATPESVQSGQPTSNNPVPVDTQVTVHPSHFLTVGERFRLQTQRTFGPLAFLTPAGEAGITMAHPPQNYPREWKDGAAAFGRIYGSEFARHTTGGFTHFGTAWIDHEDPRYFRTANTNFGRRIGHAMLFTFFDRTNSGRRTLALSNLAGSTAAGFVGNLWEPDGFNDATHALQRSALEFGTLSGANLVAEFSPDLSRLMHKMHLPDSVANALLPKAY
jgi:hypothetical protein